VCPKEAAALQDALDKEKKKQPEEKAARIEP